MQGKEIGRSRLALVSTGGRDRAAETATAAPAGAGLPSLFSTAVPDRYFETPALRDCHARIARAALDSDTVAVVEGERGCGRTTFARILQQRVGASADLCFIDVRIPQGERYVLDCLRRTFSPGQPADAQALTAQLVERSRHGKACLIVVDDADRLSVFALRQLFALKRAVTDAGGRVGVVVTMSSSRLEAALALPSMAPFRARGLTRVELPHFSVQETADYLRARIESAGLVAAISFDDAQVRRIHQASGGLPQHIKRVAGELLEGARPRPYRSARRMQRQARITHTLIPLAFVIVPLICIGLLLKAIFARPADEAVAERLMNIAGVEASGTAVPLPPMPAPVASGAVDRAPDAPAARVVKTPDTVPANPAPTAQTLPPAPVVETPPPAVTPRQAPPETSRSAPSAPEPTGQPAAVAPEIEPASVPGTAAPVRVPRPEAAAALDGNAWLRAQDPGFYTLQLAGSEDRKDVEQFIEKHALPGKTVVVEVLRGGKVWYMVLYNSYSTWGEARRELGALPPQINRNNPFARRFGSVQAIALAP